ncbi:immune inhibitor A domain-containing protein [Ammoniphilus sp. CFH 90114]|uniref:immune inhibitor A domain-containing protein n=1 Tax=Ammoniphilus sp. CFH 90114 TaxID=2493665 RepID=UPI00100E4BE1|nr:immune inhibitor A domain-containing protein [Ammoniphilus sp. CFH 90114]RXT03734.1 M6 family metalloprotease domain-containing protein [Ammoniphilus sp. CFH 90114]
MKRLKAYCILAVLLMGFNTGNIKAQAQNFHEEAHHLANKTYVDREQLIQEFQTSGEDAIAFEKVTKRNQERVRRETIERMGEQRMMMFHAKQTQPRLHTDQVVVALIEFPDRKHNRIPAHPENRLWLEDFSQEHYRDMLFSKEDYVTPNGIAMTSMAQYYYQQSGGSWTVEGEVTPWMQSVHSYVYYGENTQNERDEHVTELIKETLSQVGSLVEGKEDVYDQRDPYDMNGNGIILEADGFLDNLMVVHAGIAEQTMEDDQAIFSHRSSLSEPVPIPGTNLLAYDYMIQPEDGPPGVFTHEYGHNLNLPDLYDTTNSGLGSPVGGWSLMANGGFTGEVARTRPTGLDPWSKLYLQTSLGGNWVDPIQLHWEELKNGNQRISVKEASDFDPRDKVIKLDLPPTLIPALAQPKDGTYSYYSDNRDYLNNWMISPWIDLSSVTSDVYLEFDSFRSVEEGYDFFILGVMDDVEHSWEPLAIYSDHTDGWVKDTIDLSAYIGRQIKLQFRYMTDSSGREGGYLLDNINLTADGEVILSDDAEGPSSFDINGFLLHDGSDEQLENYYLVELRSHNGVDQGLSSYVSADSYFTYDPGVVIWAYNGSYESNDHAKENAGYGMLGVVDAHRQVKYISGDKNNPAHSIYQISDAAFGLNFTSERFLSGPAGTIHFSSQAPVSLFYDGYDYSIPEAPVFGRVLPQLGLMIQVQEMADDASTATLELGLTDSDPSKLAFLQFDKEEYQLAIGGQRQTQVTATYTDGTQTNVTTKANYQSSEPTIAEVDQLGLLTGITLGVTELQAQYVDKEAKAQVTVTTEPVDECFIATASFGSKFDPAVTLLRHFRDDYLMTTEIGKKFVAWYYQVSPPIAQYIADSDWLKALVRGLLTPIVGLVYVLYHPIVLYLAVGVAVMTALRVYLRRMQY